MFTADSTFGERSRGALERCVTEGRLIVCEVVVAEIAAAFPTPERAGAALQALGVVQHPSDTAVALLAGASWRDYHRRGGRRERVIADFLIAAHAATHAERLLTRDRGFSRGYFAGLEILDPSA